MASASPQSIVVDRPLEGLLARLGVNGAAERALFEASWRQLCRHAALFGYADHPDVDVEHLELAQHVVHEQLAQWARRGDARAVEHEAVRTMLSALRGAIGLAATPPRPELATLLGPAQARLCAAARCQYVPLVELFHYNRSLERHYRVHESFVELVDWCVAAIEHARDAPPDAEGLTKQVRRFVAVVQHLRPNERRLPSAERGTEASARAKAVAEDLPPELVGSPPALADRAAASAPAHDAEPGAGYMHVLHWYELLGTQLDWGALERTGAEGVGTPRRLPPLLHSALLVHLLGLEDRRRKAVLSAAVDRLLVHRFIPAAHAVGSRNNRHEPVAALLVSVIGAALRPWSFVAPALRPDERIVLVALLAELATSKALKLLHDERQHADAHDEPQRIRTAVNRALARWPGCVHEVSPKQRIDRVVAGMRYLSRVRRGTEPRVRDLAIVGELLGR
ncbi:hypothetical protein [Paraliomyxa miuraensis]|uniref:hypothetical protein n=1 Tax=Paraliomyxa miuraensis TaxID=376150 RepID=UPI00224F0EB9|nr:hypothetical protein [Paraliomyxa miuraensis]MCX4247376.1 hypothetical protein [Paraliomyxa miuraensis]